jgi:hypothetical protein
LVKPAKLSANSDAIVSRANDGSNGAEHLRRGGLLIGLVVSTVYVSIFAQDWLGLLASAAAGWTFACGGFYAARVAAGHLPLLEAYPALPLLLWVIESQLQALSQGNRHGRILTIAGSSACIMLAGHPQLPVYAMAAGAFYALWRGGRHAIRIWSAMILGVGCAAFALVPMGMLVGRSTRLLDLAPPANDIAMPYGRLTAFFLPWRDGVPPLLDADPTIAFQQYPNLAYFWDTNCYIGILPWVALILLIYVSKRSDRVAINMNIMAFLGIIGVAGIILSLPIVRYVPSLVPGTIFRSSSRLLYLTEFVLACGLGIGIHWTFATNKASARILMAVLLALHMVDLGSHSRRFILRGSLLTGSDSRNLRTSRPISLTVAQQSTTTCRWVSTAP